MKALSTRLLFVLAVVGMLTLSATPASAFPCNWNPYSECLDCCDNELENCLDSCGGGTPSQGCLGFCFWSWYGCQDTCIYDPLASFLAPEPNFSPAEGASTLAELLVPTC